MASKTFYFTSSYNWAFTGSLLGGTATSSVTASFSAIGAGGHGSRTGTGGSGGGYAETGDANAGIILESGSCLLYICVGQATATDGGTSSVSSASYVFVRAAGGKQNGSISHQAVLMTGSIYKYVGGAGGENFTGYDNYNGGGGGSRAGQLGIGCPGLSGLYATREGGAPGGKVPNAVPFFGGSGSYYLAGANQNRIVPAGNGEGVGCGGGGGYDYPFGVDNSGAGSNGYVTITLNPGG